MQIRPERNRNNLVELFTKNRIEKGWADQNEAVCLEMDFSPSDTIG